MKKILIIDREDIMRRKRIHNKDLYSLDPLYCARTREDVEEADVVGVLDETGNIITVLKSINLETGRKISLSEFGSMAALGEI